MYMCLCSSWGVTSSTSPSGFRSEPCTRNSVLPTTCHHRERPHSQAPTTPRASPCPSPPPSADHTHLVAPVAQLLHLPRLDPIVIVVVVMMVLVVMVVTVVVVVVIVVVIVMVIVAVVMVVVMVALLRVMVVVVAAVAMAMVVVMLLHAVRHGCRPWSGPHDGVSHVMLDQPESPGVLRRHHTMQPLAPHEA